MNISPEFKGYTLEGLQRWQEQIESDFNQRKIAEGDKARFRGLHSRITNEIIARRQWQRKVFNAIKGKGVRIG